MPPFSVASPVSATAVGGVFGVDVTVILNVSLAVRPPTSVAVTLTPTVPVEVGVPLKVRVPGLNASHAGSADPSIAVAVYVSESPLSTSVKVPAGSVRVKAEPTLVL